MRVAVISDIHGNQLALEAVLHDLHKHPPYDELVIAGDLCLNGPRPREVLEIVQELRCPVIQGNVDQETVTRAPEKGKKKRSIVGWTREHIGREGIAYLAALPFSHRVVNPPQGAEFRPESLNRARTSLADNTTDRDEAPTILIEDNSAIQPTRNTNRRRDLLVVHANPLNLEDALFPDANDATLESLLGGLDEQVGALAFGHLHIAYTRRWRGLLLADVASCGLPRDGDTRAAYSLLTWQEEQQCWEAEIRRIPYDIQAVIEQFKTCGMPHAAKRIRILLEAHY